MDLAELEGLPCPPPLFSSAVLCCLAPPALRFALFGVPSSVRHERVCARVCACSTCVCVCVMCMCVMCVSCVCMCVCVRVCQLRPLLVQRFISQLMCVRVFSHHAVSCRHPLNFAPPSCACMCACVRVRVCSAITRFRAETPFTPHRSSEFTIAPLPPGASVSLTL